MRARVPVFIAVMAIIAIAVGGLATATVAGEDTDLVHECAAPMPDDYADPPDGNDTIGWFDGYWYDEPLDVNVSDGLTEEELEKLSARTAARLEAMRCLPFERMPSVEVMDRETFAEEQAEFFEGIDDRTRMFDNTQFETLLTIGSDVDTIEVREEARAVTVGGYYDFVEEHIVVITEDPDAIGIDEGILAHELGHALQDQHFNLEEYERDTKDRDKGKLGVIEGDVHRVEMAYLERCEEERWEQPCLTEENEGGSSGDGPPSWGQYFMEFQPYSDGPAFVEHIYTEGDGWEAVNALYDDMPDSTIYTIHPEYYGELEPEDLEVPDRSAEHWDRMTWNDSPDHNVIGQAGMSAMFMGQTVDDPMNGVIDFGEILNDDDFNPLNYHHEETDGWRGDRLYVYSDQHNRTASVWKTAWADEDEMTTFLSAYEDLAAAQGGERVPGYAHTWNFHGTDEYNMSVTLYPDGDRLWIVTAPTYGELTSIHGDIELIDEASREVSPPNHDSNGVNDDPPDDNGEEPADQIPGFTLIAGVAALALLAGRFHYERRTS